MSITFSSSGGKTGTGDSLSSMTSSGDVSRLLGEVNRLKEQLSQSEKDKEFVWSLWKRLQTANPDVCAAVADVQRHEQIKQEQKDNKVLAVLESKDSVIRDLEEELDKLQNELHWSREECERLNKFKSQLEEDNSVITERVREIELLVSEREHSANLKQQNTHQIVQEMHQQTVGLKARCDALNREVDSLRSNNSELSSRNSLLTRKVNELEEEVQSKATQLEKLNLEHRYTVEDRMQLDFKLKSQCNESMTVNQELSKVSEENRSLKASMESAQTALERLTIDNRRQAELIRQLQSLQKDTEGVMKNQEDVYNTEKKNYQSMYYETSEKLKEAIAEEQNVRYEYEQMKLEFRSENSDLKSKLAKMESELKNLKPKKTLIGSELCDVCCDCTVKIKAYENEIQILQSKLNERNRLIQSLELKDTINQRNRSADQRRSGSRKGSATRTKSLSPVATNRNALELARKLSVSENKVSNLTVKLKASEAELEEVKKAHERRLARFKSLQKEMMMLREQLKTYETTNDYEQKPRNLNDFTTNLPKDKIVKQMEAMKKENRSLANQKIELQEMVDRLRVERARDSALMKDLEQNLANEANNKTNDTEVRKWIDECRKLETKILDLKEELIISEQAKDALAKECNSLTEDIEALRNAANEYSNAKPKKPVKKPKLKLTSRSSASNKSKSSSRSKLGLNLSLLRNIDENNSMTNEEEEEEEFEEVRDSDTGNDESDTLQTATANSSQSLGYRIREVAKANGKIERATRLHTRCRNKTQSVQTDIDLSNASTLAHLVGIMSNSNTPRDTTEESSVVDWHQGASFATKSSKVGRRNSTLTAGVKSNSDTSKKSKGNSSTNSNYKTKQLVKNLKADNFALNEKCEMLNEQNAALKSAKTSLQSTIDGLQGQLDKLQSEQQNLSSKLRCAKLKEQKLTADVEKLEREKSQFEAKKETNSSAKLDSEVRSLETRLRNAQNEINRQKQEIKSLSDEQDQKNTECKNLQDKIGRLERDISQKRSLIENLRFKIRSFEDTAKNDLKLQNDFDAKAQALKETSENAKRTIENLRAQLTHYKGLNVESLQKVEKLEKQLKASESKKHEFENFANEMETVATSQLEGLAMQSEVAIEKLQNQLKDAGVIVKEFITVFRSFANELVAKMSKQSRELSTRKLEQHKSALSHGMLAARSKAAEILDLSSDDIDEIMTPNDSGIGIYSKTEAYRGRVEQVLNSKAPFANEMIALLLEVLSEYSKVTAESAVLKAEAA